MDIRSTPLLTAREAARHLNMPESTLDRWLVETAGPGPLVHAVIPERRGWPRMPFLAIVEAYVLRSLRQLKLSMDEIRESAEFVRHEFGDEFALANERIATDGITLFVKLADNSVIHPRTGQLGIRQVLDDYLRYIAWGDDGAPKFLRLRQYPATAEVIIDPRFGWGAPVLAKSKVPVDSMLELWRNGEPIRVVASEFNLPQDVVEDVLRAAAA